MNFSKTTKTVLFLSGVFANYPIKIVGVIKLSEIILFIYFLINVNKVIGAFKKEKELRRVSLYIFLLFFLSLFSSFYNDASSISIMKGAANILVFFTLILSMFLLLKKNISYLLYFLIPYGLCSLLFSPYSYDISDNILLNYLYENSIGGEFDNFFDVIIAPFFNPLLMAFVLFNRNKYLSSIIIFIYGLLAIFFEAKSVGFIFLFSALIFYLKIKGFRPSIMRLKFYILFGLLFCIPLVSIVLRKINNLNASDNIYNTRIEQVDNFNPFLLVGRPDPIVGILAIIDQPLIGHGFNKMDNSYTALAISLGFLPYDYSSKWEGIQDHSNLIHSIVEGGLFACLIWLFILNLSIKSFYLSLVNSFDQFTIIIFIFFFYMFWNILFSPISRLDFGYIIAFLIIYNNLKKSTIKNQY